MEKSIYLSPRKILSYLKDLESKIPVVNKSPYIASDSNQFQTNQDLEKEAKNILNYVGLEGCIPTCKFEKIEENVAGFTINSSSKDAIPITVSQKYIGNPKACCAILAHEICHKVIYLNGIDFKRPIPQEFNEIFVDLCTIYIGLGKIVLDGYIAAGTNTLQMGYLQVDMYRQTYNIIAYTTKRYDTIGELTDMNDPYLEDAIGIWKNSENVQQILRDTFFKNENELAEVNRNIVLLQQILNQVFTQHGEVFRKLSKQAVDWGIFDTLQYDKPIALFSGVYESLFDHSEKEKFSLAQRAISNLILSLTDEYEAISLGALSYDSLKCPNCGYTSKTTIEDRDAIIKCPSCGIYFRFCNSHLNITKMRKLRDEQIARKKEERSKLQKEAYQKGWKDGVAKIPKWMRWLIRKNL